MYIVSRVAQTVTLFNASGTKVQAYIRALRKAGTPVNVNIVLAAAEGAVTAVDGTLL